jgi:hypothetical protein
VFKQKSIQFFGCFFAILLARMNWAQRRQLTYVLAFLIVFGAIAFVVVRNATRTVPTCFDGKKNGDEVGVDCGGVCAFYCKDELGAPKVRWWRYFDVTPGIIHAVAYIEHSYPNAASQKVAYHFDVYDAKNNLIKTQPGTTYLGPLGRSAIVETLIPVGNTVPASVRFMFDGAITWEKIPGTFSQIVIKTDRYLLESFDGGTRLTATLENDSRMTFKGMDVVAILYDKNDNAIAVSKSVLKTLPAQTDSTMYFTWPQQLREQTARVEVLPRINPFTAQSL